MGSYSVVQCVRHLMGQPLHCSAANAGVWGERGYGDGSTPLQVTRQYCLGSMAAPLSSTGISHHNLLPHIPLICHLQSTAALTLRLFHKPYAPAPSCCPFQGTCVPVWGMYGVAGTVLFSFHLGCHRSAVSLLALNVLPLTQTIALMWG